MLVVCVKALFNVGMAAPQVLAESCKTEHVVVQDARIKMLEGAVTEARAQAAGAMAAAQTRAIRAAAFTDAEAVNSRSTALAAASGEVGDLHQGATFLRMTRALHFCAETWRRVKMPRDCSR